MRKRIVALMLSAAMVLGCAPLRVHAEEVNAEEVVETVEEQNSTEAVEEEETVNTTVDSEEVASQTVDNPFIEECLQYDGYTYEDGTLYYKGLPLDNNAMYVETDAEGNTYYYDTLDPLFDEYVLNADNASENVLRQDAKLATYTTGANKKVYLSPDSVDGKTAHLGIDVSYHNGTINWKELKKRGVEFAFIRVGYRGLSNSVIREDAMFKTNIEGAYAAGVRVGIYFYSQAISDEEALQEAAFVQQQLAPYKDKISLPVFFDVERDKKGRIHAYWSQEEAANLDVKNRHIAIVNTFCDAMTRAGYTTGLYSYYSLLMKDMNLSALRDSYYIWIARTNDALGYNGRVNCWQYAKYDGFKDCTSANQFKPKHDGNLDLNFWYGDFLKTPTNEASAKTFVTHLYRAALQREPDEEGLNNWVNVLKRGEMTGADVAHEFYLSKEMLYRNLTNAQFVDCVYQGMLGRSADPAGRASWVAALDAGASYEYVFAGFVGSQEFIKLCADSGIERGNYKTTQGRDRNLNVTRFVSRLYSKALGRGYDAEGLNNWCNAINNNPSKENILYVSTTGFLHSQEFLKKNLTDEEYVKVLYRVYLDREYDAPGLADWTNRLKQGVTRDEVARGFAYSPEFGRLMSSYGL